MPMTFNLRVFLWAALIAALFMNFEMWQHAYPPAPSPASAPATTAAPLDCRVPTAPAPAAPAAPPPASATRRLPGTLAAAVPRRGMI